MPYFTGEIRVTVVFLEQSQWFALGGTDDYLTCSPGAADVPSVLSKSTTYSGLGTPMEPGLGSIQGKVAMVRVVSVCPKPSISLMPVNLRKGFVYGRIQCLACDRAVLQGRKVVMRRILPNQEAEDGRRSAERCDMIILYHLQDVGRMELFMVVYETVAPAIHCPYSFPHGLSSIPCRPRSDAGCLRAGYANNIRSRYVRADR